MKKMLLSLLVVLVLFCSNSAYLQNTYLKNWMICYSIHDTCFIIDTIISDINAIKWKNQVAYIDNYFYKKQLKFSQLPNSTSIANLVFFKGNKYKLRNNEYYFTFLIQIKHNNVVSPLGEFIYHEYYGTLLVLGEYKNLYVKKIECNNLNKSIDTEKIINEITTFFQILPPLPKI